MVCATCEAIPLDLFLPASYKQMICSRGRGNPRDVVWNYSYVHYRSDDGRSGLERLRQSARNGCLLCEVLEMVIDRGVESRCGLEEAQDTHVRLQVQSEGELQVRTGRTVTSLGWDCQDTGWGSKDTYSTYGSGTGVMRQWPKHQDAATNANAPLDICAEWLEQCISGHQVCHRRRQGAGNPTHLIKLLGNDGLCLTIPDPDTNLRYAALSYCWGGGRGFVKTTTANFSQRLERIDPSDLSQTFQEAVMCTRRLGLKYLWIDAMCIIQDNLKQVQTECSRMDSIFSGALVTFAAASGQGGSSTMLTHRNPRLMQGATIHARDRKDETSPDGDPRMTFTRPTAADVHIFPCCESWPPSIRGALTTRGWTLQERELSPRIIHFTHSRTVWECRHSIASDDRPLMESGALEPKRILGSGGTVTWQCLMEDYSRRNLSVATDKLTAIAGVARVYAAAKDRYLAGIWLSDLPVALTWMPGRHSSARNGSSNSPLSRPSDPRVPSWSWASYNGPVKFAGEGWFESSWTQVGEKWVREKSGAQIIDANTTPATDDIYGPVFGGALTLQSRAFGISLGETSMPGKWKAMSDQRYELKTSYKSPSMTLYFDHSLTSLNTAYLCFQLSTELKARRNWPAWGLLLFRLPSGEYRRVGIFRADSMGNAPMRTVRIV